MLLTSPWRLSLLFLVSGVATGYLLERQGVRGFLGRRSVRLLVPLVFGDARDRAAAVVSRSRREGAVRRQLRRVLGALSHGLPRFLPRRGLPDPADLESPLVRRVSVGLHAARCTCSCARLPGPCRGCVPGSSGGSWGSACCCGRSCISPRRACCSPCVSRRRTRSSTTGTTMRSTLLVFLLGFALVGTRAPWETRGAPTLACARSRRTRLGVPLRLARDLWRRRRAPAVDRLSAALAARVQCANVARDHGRSRLRAPASLPRQRGAPLSDHGRFFPSTSCTRPSSWSPRTRCSRWGSIPCSRASCSCWSRSRCASWATKPFGE